MDDIELLRRYSEQRSEEAFAELVSGHVNLVYSTALRLVGEADLAEAVVQVVFLDLARKAKTLCRGTVLAGWLYRSTCLAAANLPRGERARWEGATKLHSTASLSCCAPGRKGSPHPARTATS
jgi:DNA-directed RNA polymerase specialized sigma24 family protein